MKKAESTEQVDMSPQAVAARLRDLASMHALGMSLMKARRLGPVEARDARGTTAEGGAPPAPHLDREQ